MSDETPVEARVRSAESAPDGVIAPSGVTALKAALAGNASAFADWRRQPMTRVVLRALQAFLVHPPKGSMPVDAAVQYGVTQGLLLAFQVATDPSVVWPGVFGEPAGTVGAALPEMDFETPLDEVLK